MRRKIIRNMSNLMEWGEEISLHDAKVKWSIGRLIYANEGGLIQRIGPWEVERSKECENKG